MLDALLPNIDETSKLVREIADASEDQRDSSQQISVALQQLEQIAVQNSSIAVELETASTYMQSLVEQLQGLMRFFHVDEQGALDVVATENDDTTTDPA
jgi:methyl-accepting chemotaxis protein